MGIMGIICEECGVCLCWMVEKNSIENEWEFGGVLK